MNALLFNTDLRKNVDNCVESRNEKRNNKEKRKCKLILISVTKQ
jgi:hypothetical protein